MTEQTLFPLGATVITAAAQCELTEVDVQAALDRHAHGDWGDMSQEDLDENARALAEGDRLFSAYHAASGKKFWIISEADRSATTVLLPEDY